MENPYGFLLVRFLCGLNRRDYHRYFYVCLICNFCSNNFLLLFFPFVQSTGLLFNFYTLACKFSRTSNQAVMLIYEIKWLFKYNQLFLKSKRTLAVLNLFIVFIAAASAIASMRKRNSYDGRNNFNRQPKVCKHTFFTKL